MRRIHEAAQAGANLAVLPEYHLGERPLPEGTPDSERRELCTHWQEYLHAYCVLARQCRICIVPGSFAELRHSSGASQDQGTETVVNATYFIDHDGNILGRYEKKNVWHPERGFITAGTDQPHQAFDTPLGKVGLLICWDLAFPEAFRELVAQGAKMVVIPSYWKLSDAGDIGMKRNPVSEKIFMDAALTSRAFENTCAVVYCNVGGPVDDGFAGCSQVTVPFLGCIGRVDSSEETVMVVEVGMDVVDEAESVYKIREDMACASWHYTLCSRTN